MTVLMYDSDTPTDIPVDVSAVAGYPDLWPEASWGRFQTALRVRIARSAFQNDGHVLDVETTLATPAQAPGWAMRRLNATGWPAVGIYVNRGNWQAVYDACRGLPIRWWVATLDGTQTVSGPAGPLAVQYCGAADSGDPCQSAGHYDLSICDPAFFEGWFMTQDQINAFARVLIAVFKGRTPFDQAELDSIVGALTPGNFEATVTKLELAAEYSSAAGVAELTLKNRLDKLAAGPATYVRHTHHTDTGTPT